MEETSRQRTKALLEAIRKERKFKTGFTITTFFLATGALAATWGSLDARTLVVIATTLTGARWGANYLLFALWTKPRLAIIEAKYPRKSGPKLPGA